ncbi:MULTISPECIES: DUF3043 domain-containing protein [Microbacterium]|uniref:DUF3043 domain-containing protein n=2 Tax=Microbacterium maritypicum TaxID=33918 RepID=A0AAD3X7U4_MICMQ|nr:MULTISPECIES: DUF3043 domain-containing protein [Microbacterium]AZS46841.1 hypothetical protein CVS53_01521 [Microbacterium oxydans]EYT58884.1 membrane protein [Microbacterium sp. UCD-TDU]KAB1887725.1 DUF3043 domain-containing protein [Microbacterium liquefaciens]KQV03513.1 hypothetical protein ASC55_00515 [Microbacterium sp. Root322]KQY75932.1 hypothetical protein ASD13_06770 [Microbacterium sp. Root1433D1]
MSTTPTSPSTNDDTPETTAVGKGRATPTRAEQEAARRRPLVANTKEAKAAAKAELNERRARAQAGMAAGEEKYLPVRDKGPQRRWVRDYVDAGWHPAEFVMGVMVLVILASLVPANTVISFYAYIVMMGYLVIAIGGMILLGMRVKRKAAAKFGKERLERGLGWYAAMRALQMRFMRLPKPQVKRGQYPD